MNRVWIVCAALAASTHALVLFAIQPGTLAEPRLLGDESSSIELSLVEAGPPAPVSIPASTELPPEPEPPPPTELEPPPVVAEPMPEPERAIDEPKPLPQPRAPVRKPRVAAPVRRPTQVTAPSAAASNPGSGVASNPGRSTSARPRYRSNPKPNYPAESRRAGQQGVVLITVQVSAAGNAASVQVSRSSGFPLLDSAALQAVRQWTFEPARAAGIPIASQVEVPVRFDLNR